MEAWEATEFATRWLDAANSHDINKIMSFYAQDAELISPVVQEELKEPSGRIRGQAALRAYFDSGIKTYSLHLIEAAAGVSSLTAWYANNKGTRTSAYLELGPDGKITRNVIHYNAQLL
jgi:ketosteroid isomerase-like protein